MTTSEPTRPTTPTTTVKPEPKQETKPAKQEDTIKRFDAFEDGVVTFKGTNGQGYMKIHPNKISEGIYRITERNKDGTLSNGDKVTVGLYEFFHWYDESDDKKVAGMLEGYAPIRYQRTYTVSGLDEGLTSPSQLSASTIADLNEKDIKDLHYWLFPTLLSSAKIGDTRYVGCYLFTERRYNYPMNQLFLIYETDIALTDEETGKVTEVKTYLPVIYQNIALNPNDSITYEERKMPEKYASYDIRPDKTYFSIQGHQTLSGCFNYYIKPLMEYYESTQESLTPGYEKQIYIQ